MKSLNEAIARLPSSKSWLRFFLYALIICSALTRTGVDISIFMVLLVALYRGIRNPPREGVPWLVLTPFLLLLLVAIVSTLASDHLLDNMEALLHYFRFALPFAMLPALFAVDARRLLLVFLGVFTLMTLYGIVQYFAGVNWLRFRGMPLPPLDTLQQGAAAVFRAKGTYRNPIVYSTAMLMIAPFFFSLFLSTKGRERRVWLVGAVMGVVGVVASVTRSAGIGLFVGMLVQVLRLRPRYAVPIIAAALAVFAALATLTATGFMKEHLGGPRTPPVVSRFVNTTLDTGVERLYRWQAGWMAIKKNPWLGVGPDGDLKSQVIRYMILVSRKHDNYQYRLLPTGLIHNVHIQMAFQMGLFGFLVEMLMWGSVFLWNGIWLRRAGEGFPMERGILWGANGALAGSFVDGIFNNNLLDSPSQAMIMIFIGFSLFAGVRIRQGLAAPDSIEAGSKPRKGAGGSTPPNQLVAGDSSQAPPGGSGSRPEGDGAGPLALTALVARWLSFAGPTRPARTAPVPAPAAPAVDRPARPAVRAKKGGATRARRNSSRLPTPAT